jgi:hypothetical protein
MVGISKEKQTLKSKTIDINIKTSLNLLNE